MAFVFGYPRFRALLSDGSPAVGYKLYSYLAGTATPEPTYTDQTEATANPNPTILDSNGEAAVWLKPDVAYKLVLKTTLDETVWTVDSIRHPYGGVPLTIAQGGTGATTAQGARDNLLSVEDSRTSSVAVVATHKATTTGTPAAGIGIGEKFQAESADESPSDFGQVEFAASDVGAGSEDTYFQVLLRVAGAALAAVYRWVATTTFKAIFSHGNTADRTYTLPDASGTVVLDTATQALGNKTVNTNAPATPTANGLYVESLIKGWVVTSGGGAWTIDADLNVSSIVDNGTGDLTINWATPFASANYAVVAMASHTVAGVGYRVQQQSATRTASSCRLLVVNISDVLADPAEGISAIAIGAQ